MWWFWVGAALFGGALSAVVLRRAARAAQAPVDQEPERDIYLRQLAEIEQLASRGLLSTGELGVARAETGRRLLRAAALDRPDGGSVGRGGCVIIAAAAAPLLAAALYAVLGSPDLSDQPYRERLARWRASDPASLGPLEASAVLTQVTRERPRDARALIYLARAQAASGQQASALRSLRRAADIEPGRAEVWAVAGELQAGPRDEPLSSSARAAFERALALDPRADSPRYFLGGDLIARGRRLDGLRLWESLRADIPPTDPRRRELESDIRQAREAA